MRATFILMNIVLAGFACAEEKDDSTAVPLGGEYQSRIVRLGSTPDACLKFSGRPESKLFLYPSHVIVKIVLEDENGNRHDVVIKQDRLALPDCKHGILHVYVKDLLREEETRNAALSSLGVTKDKFEMVAMESAWNSQIVVLDQEIKLAHASYLAADNKSDMKFSFRLSANALTILRNAEPAAIGFEFESNYRAKFKKDVITIVTSVIDRQLDNFVQNLRSNADADGKLLFVPVGGEVKSDAQWKELFQREVTSSIETGVGTKLPLDMTQSLLNKLLDASLKMLSDPNVLLKAKSDEAVRCILGNGFKTDIAVNKLTEMSNKLDNYSKGLDELNLETLKKRHAQLDSDFSYYGIGGSFNPKYDSLDELKKKISILREAHAKTDQYLKGEISVVRTIDASAKAEISKTVSQVLIAQFTETTRIGQNRFINRLAFSKNMEIDEVVPLGGVIVWPYAGRIPHNYEPCNGGAPRKGSRLATHDPKFVKPDYSNKFLMMAEKIQEAPGAVLGQGGRHTIDVTHSHLAGELRASIGYIDDKNEKVEHADTRGLGIVADDKKNFVPKVYSIFKREFTPATADIGALQFKRTMVEGETASKELKDIDIKPPYHEVIFIIRVD